MAPRKLLFAKKRKQTPTNSVDESSEEEGTSDSNRGKALKKPKSAVEPLPIPEPEPEEDGSTCSTPTTSGFIILPAAKPSGKKKTPASKKFSDEEVIALLKGLSLFWSNGRNNKWAEFHEFMKDDLGNKFSKIQVSEKIRTLRKKFERARANGGRLDFSDPHESLVFQLSEVVWGDDSGIGLENGKSAAESTKKSRKRAQLDAPAEEKLTAEKQKQEDEHVENRKRAAESHQKSRKRKKLDAPAEEQTIAEEQKQEKSRKRNQLDAPAEEQKIAEEQKQENGHGEDDEENHTSEKGKQVKEFDEEDFQSDFPLLYASFDKYGFPTIAKEKCVLIPREKAQELEEKWRELDADICRLELKRIELIKRDLEDRLQTK